jgi:hypothetical protein
LNQEKLVAGKAFNRIIQKVPNEYHVAFLARYHHIHLLVEEAHEDFLSTCFNYCLLSLLPNYLESSVQRDQRTMLLICSSTHDLFPEL